MNPYMSNPHFKRKNADRMRMECALNPLPYEPIVGEFLLNRRKTYSILPRPKVYIRGSKYEG